MTHDPATSGVPTSLPCPEWCDLPAGHPLEAAVLHDVSAGLFRVHRRRFGDRPTHVATEAWEHPDHCAPQVVTEAWERAVSEAGPSDLGTDADAFLVRLQLSDGHGYVTATGARRLAQLLTEAADTLDPVTTDGEGQ